jgi:hypothetical protein
MHIHQLLALCVLLSLPLATANAQFKYANKYWEAGIALGTSSYSGELTTSIIDPKHLHFAGGAFVRYHPSRFVGLRLQAMYGSLSGNDADSKDAINQIRNLSYKSHIFDAAVSADFFVLGYNPEKSNMFSPYLSVGLSVFNFNPKAKHFDPNLFDQWVELQPLHTEGQGSIAGRTEYKRTQAAVPLSIGLLYAVHSHINIGLEVGYRVTFTDYLDDVGLYYPIDAVSGQSSYDQTPYRDGFFDNKSMQEIMADRTYEYFVRAQGAQLGTDNVLATPEGQDEYARYQQQRGGIYRGAKGNDSYLFATFIVSYNFIDNGLVGARNRRKRKGGCPGAQF